MWLPFLFMYTTENKREAIYRKYTDYDLFKHFEPNIDFKHNIKSTLRSDDDTPSLRLYVSSNGTVCFVDYGLTTGNFWEFLKLKYGWDYFTALDNVYNALNGVKITGKVVDHKKLNETTRIHYKVRKAEQYDFNHWNQYFSTPIIKQLGILPISHYFMYGNTYEADYKTYIFKVGSRVKIYQPEKKPKYFGNTNSSSIQGWHLLNPSVKRCLLVSSLKEIGTLLDIQLHYDIPKFNVIAPNSESSLIPFHIIRFLKSIWNLEILYDWDRAGIINAKKHSTIYNIPINNLQYRQMTTKDISDFRKDYGLYNTKEIWI